MPEIWEIVGTWRSLRWADALPLAAACFVAGVMERRGALTLGSVSLSFAGGAFALGAWWALLQALPCLRPLAGGLGRPGPEGAGGWLRFFAPYLVYGLMAWPFLGGVTLLRCRKRRMPFRKGLSDSLLLAAFTGCCMVPYVSALTALGLVLAVLLYGLGWWLHSGLPPAFWGIG